ncbi:uncharacterized protein LOC126903640 isoform X2 [Daktulosphaira vitifoliae]|uniref:uncharacterized protein LOC126903640 isoform X2 n=1 Tax=Daktulosphaira vitifoliae TaxID=58002 RepID=UPI0021AA2031|nr:uncharacterized protein LOC126903640 isoform X2 [Daktulosphaira vitifoliae]
MFAKTTGNRCDSEFYILRQKFIKVDSTNMDSILEVNLTKKKERKCNNLENENSSTTLCDNLPTKDNLQKNSDKDTKIDKNQSKFNTEEASVLTTINKNNSTKNNIKKKSKNSKCLEQDISNTVNDLSNKNDNQENSKEKKNSKCLKQEEDILNTLNKNKFLVKSEKKKKKRNKSNSSIKLNQSDNNSNISDLEEQYMLTNNNLEYEELDENLFKMGKEYAFAHCVAEDLRMGAGIALEFKRTFGCLGKLFDQHLKVGDVGVLNHKNQYIFYLVTKKYSNRKPTFDALKNTLVELLNKMKKNNLTKLAIPKIGCGLDGLDWFEVQNFIKKLFYGSGIHITVCAPSLSKITDNKISSKALNIYTTKKNLWEMENNTDIILIINRQNLKQCKLDSISNKINAKYSFKEQLLHDVNHQKITNVFEYKIAYERILCIIKPSKNYYSSIEQIFRQDMRGMNNNSYTKYYALQFESPIETVKIIEIIRSVCYYDISELWLCGIEDYPEKTYYDVYCKSLRQKNVFYNRLSLNKKNVSKPFQLKNKLNDLNK